MADSENWIGRAVASGADIFSKESCEWTGIIGHVCAVVQGQGTVESNICLSSLGPTVRVTVALRDKK